MTADAFTSLRELDSRMCNNIQVRLLWSEHENRVWVSLMDTGTGATSRLDVAAGERPLDVFRHPFAYAALHGIRAPDVRAALVTGGQSV